MEEFDFLVIGSGSGLDVANAAVNRGLSVAIVEKGPLGGDLSQPRLYPVEDAALPRRRPRDGRARASSTSAHLVIVGGGYIAAELAHFFGTFGSDVTIVGRRPNLLPEADDEAVTVIGDELLLAAGRVPNADTLAVEAAGVETDDRGFVETDEYLLKHSANHETAAVARNQFGEELEPVDYTAMPFAVFASPEVAGVGACEQDLRAAGREYATRTYPYDQTTRGSAMKAGSGTVRDLRESVHIHPALSEVVQRAFSGQFTRGGGGHAHGHDHASRPLTATGPRRPRGLMSIRPVTAVCSTLTNERISRPRGSAGWRRPTPTAGPTPFPSASRWPGTTS